MSRAGIAACVLLLILLSFGVSMTNEEIGWEDTGASSKEKNFGVGGWFFGKHCPGIELFWKIRPSADSSNAFFRMKDGKIIKLDQGMAMFSPDCRYFWFTPYDGGTIKVYATATGKLMSSFSGYYPAWSPDSRKIYMSRRGQTYQLWSWSLTDGEKGPLLEVKDYCVCYPFGDTVDWSPVDFDSTGNIEWTYPTCEEAGRSGFPRGKILTIDSSSWKTQRVQTIQLDCER